MPADAGRLAIPDTALVREARSLVEAAVPGPFVAHSLRTFHLATAYAGRRAIAHDEEGLCLAALFHDVGLFPPHRDRSLPFTVAGSRRMRAFLAERGVPGERVAPLVDAIDFHMQVLPRWSKGSVAGLLQVGAWMDVTSLRRWSVWSEAREIAAAFPRAGLDWRFPIALVRTFGGFRSCAGLVAPAMFR